MIQVEFENDNLISQLATSNDILKINSELIEGVKFKFITKNYLGKQRDQDESNLLDINQLQSDKDSNHKLYESSENLLDDILKNGKYKHQNHLQYLASQHAKTILKIRFVLNPFSFVFLLTGKEQFHIVLETLDTEEATYIWHIDNNKRTLPNRLKDIDQALNIIRNKGRQVFLNNLPDNFSRIVHDYSDEKKGFIIWKDLLEERIM